MTDKPRTEAGQALQARVIFLYRDGTRWMDCPRDLAILMLQTTDRGGRIVELRR